MSELEPLDPSVAALFADAPHPAPPVGAAERVFARVEASIGGGAARAPDTLPARARLVPRAAARLAIAFAVGAAAGAGAVALLATPRVVYVDRPVPAAPATAPSAPPVPSAPVAPSASPAAPSSASVRPRASAEPRPAPSRTDDLADERLLVDDARARLASGDAAGALARLAEHDRRFSRGRLAEESEALRIQALVNAGRYDEARARAEAFRRASPHSVFWPAIDVTLGSIP